MSTRRSRRLALAGGVVEAHGEGRAAAMLARHLAPAPDGGGDVTVVVEFGPQAAAAATAAAGVTIRGRRGRATVTDGDPVVVRWDPGLTTMRPLVVAAHLAARRGRSVLLQGAAFAWDGRAAVVAGPSGAGKTRCLLAAATAGATALAPDWSWVEVDAGLLWPLPQPLRIRPHHRGSPALTGALPASRRRLLEVGRYAPAGRVHVDVPLARLVGEPARGPLSLAGIVILDPGGAAPAATEADLRAHSADVLAGTDSTVLLAALGRAVAVRRIEPPWDPTAVVDTAKDLVGA